LDSFGKERILFAHGGIPNDLKMAGDLEEYSKYFNQKIQMDTLEQGGYMKKYFENTAMGRHSIFWDRTMIALPEKDLASKLKNLGITRVVVGHTPHHEIINYYNLAFDIDVGMTPKCGRNMPAALVFKKDGIFAFYVNGVEKKLSEIDFA
jgi:hypothetical protein